MGIAQHKIAILLHDDFEMWHPPAWFLERLRAEFPQIEVANSRSRSTDQTALQGADIMIGWELTPELLRRATNLRWIYSITAAVDQFMFPELIESDVVISNAAQVHGRVVAEHAIAMILTLARRVHTAVRYQVKRKWAMEAIWQERPMEIAGADLLVVGLGGIGGKIAAMAAALDMRVTGVRQHPAPDPQGRYKVIGFQQLDDALPKADFVVLALPLTPQTRQIIDTRRLSLFRQSASLVNISRGQLVDEAALVKALREGRLRGAALDVFNEEPLPWRSKLWKMPQVLITPHTAFLSEKAWERHYEVFAENLKRYLAGQLLEGVVDKRRGY